jgi:hypothetical protein
MWSWAHRLSAVRQGAPAELHRDGSNPAFPLPLPLQANPAEGGGQIISPFSIAQALGMLLNGVEPGSDSAEQIRVSCQADECYCAWGGTSGAVTCCSASAEQIRVSCQADECYCALAVRVGQ